MDDNLKYQILNDLHTGGDPRAVSAAFDVSYATVIRLNKQLLEEMENATGKLDLERVRLGQASYEMLAEENSPIIGASDISSDEELHDVVKALDKLQLEQIDAARHLNTKIKSLAMSTNLSHELETLVNTMCNIHKTFLAPNTTQVNIQNNLGVTPDGQSRYNAFLSDTPPG